MSGNLFLEAIRISAAKNNLANFIGGNGKPQEDNARSLFYSVQGRATQSKECVSGHTRNVISIIITSQTAPPHSFTLQKSDLVWAPSDEKPKQELNDTFLLLSVDARSNEIYGNVTYPRILARPLKYEQGQVLYDAERNRCGRISAIPSISSSDTYMSLHHYNNSRLSFDPYYLANGSELTSQTEIQKFVVGQKHKAAAGARIGKWWKCCRFNKSVRMCQAAKTIAQRRGPYTKFNHLCRNGTVAAVRDYLLRNASVFDINDEHHLTQKCPLREAAEHNNDGTIAFLVSKGADPNKADGKGFILYSCLRSTSAGSLRTTRTLLSLMETRADPDGDKGSSDRIASSDGKRYWLGVSRRRPKYRKEDMVNMGVPNLPQFYFALAGQSYAQRTLVKNIAGKLANQEKYRRLVFVLGGPPGHGKTMAAKELCQALGGESPEQDFLKISCANVNSVFELFGGAGCYKQSEVGSELNNFVVNHRSRIGVVNLDEFDRLKAEVRDGLFTIFDKGEWIDKKTSSAYQTKTLDCKNIVWVLTTNAFDNDIIRFFEKERRHFDARNWLQLDRKIKRSFKGAIESQFGDAMARRLGSVIPFVPFTKDERIALIEHEIEEWRLSYAKPTAERKKKDGPVRLVGNFEFTVDPAVIRFIADEYDESQGATSLKDFLEDGIVGPINDYHLEGENLEHTQGHFSLVGSPGEQDIEFQWPASI